MGDWTVPRKDCPRCGAHLLTEESGDSWCSYVECTWPDPPRGVDCERCNDTGLKLYGDEGWGDPCPDCDRGRGGRR